MSSNRLLRLASLMLMLLLQRKLHVEPRSILLYTDEKNISDNYIYFATAI